MKLTAVVRLQPADPSALVATMAAMNRAAQYAANEAWHHRTWGSQHLQRRCYWEVRERFGLGAQAAQQSIRKAANSYADKDRRGTRQDIDPGGAVAFDDRNLAWNMDASEVRIWTTAGRQRIPFVCGGHQRKMLAHRQGESDLIYRDGCWYLHACCDVPEPLSAGCSDLLGVDLGITNVAATSDGQLLGRGVATIRSRYDKTRGRLQSKKTKSANRLNGKRRRKESRFARDVNHCISKQIVRDAQRTGRGIALEDLGGIRERVTVRRRQRRTHHSWSFAQLRAFITYKAMLAGVQLVVVDPRNTSRTCPTCGHIAKDNRRGEKFRCQVCAFAGHADLVAASNISRKGVLLLGGGEVMRPYAGTETGSPTATHGTLREGVPLAR